MVDVPRAGKRHNLIRQPPRCTSFSGGVCSVQGESEMRGGCCFVLDVGTNPKSSCIYSLPRI